MAPRTAAGKRVKTVVLQFPGTAAVAGAAHLEVPGVDYFTPQDDIRVIGVWLRAAVNNSTALDSGAVYIYSDVSRVPRLSSDGIICKTNARMAGNSVTVGAGVTEVVFGDVENFEQIFFPEGHGCDIDEGESVYLNVSYRNTMANNHEVAATAIIYYVER